VLQVIVWIQIYPEDQALQLIVWIQIYLEDQALQLMVWTQIRPENQALKLIAWIQNHPEDQALQLIAWIKIDPDYKNTIVWIQIHYRYVMCYNFFFNLTPSGRQTTISYSSSDQASLDFKISCGYSIDSE